MKLGAENKKAAYALGGLVVVLGYVFYSNVLSGPSSPDVASAPRAAAAPVTGDDDAASQRAQLEARAHDEFMPKLVGRHDKPLDPTTVDPTLHTELIAKLDEVPAAGGGRDLFSFGKPPVELKGPGPIIIPKWVVIGPVVVKVVAPPPPPPPTPPPPINLKYYGIATTLANGKKTAFFMDGDEILLETEGVTFKGRYKLVRINAGSAVVEDTQYNHEQTLPLAEDAVASGTP